MGLLDHKWSIFKLLVFIAIYVIVILHLVLSHIHSHVSNNWQDHKDNPFLTPISGAFRRKGDPRSFIQATKDNFQRSLWNFSHSVFGVLMKPIHFIMTLITKIIAGIKHTLNVFRAQAMAIRNMFKDIVEQVASKMSNTTAAIQFYQNKMTDIIKRQKAVFQIMLYMAKAMKLTLTSLVKGPIPSTAHFFPMFGVLLLVMIAICLLCLFGGPFVKMFTCPICLVDMASLAAVGICFEARTPVYLEEGGTRAISELRLGERLKQGGAVLSRLHFRIEGKRCPVYLYRGVTVSGCHLVYTPEGPRRVEDLPEAQELARVPRDLHCVTTEQHRILAPSVGDMDHIEFADFYESGCPHTNHHTMHLIEEALAAEESPSRHELPFSDPHHVHLYDWGCAPGTPVILEDGVTRVIEDIVLGDRVRGGGVVYGIVEHTTRPDTRFYVNRGVTMSGTQLVAHSKWCRAHTVGEPLYPSPPSRFYSLVTDHHVSRAKGIEDLELRDYMEIHDDHPVFEAIHKANLVVASFSPPNLEG